MRTAAMSGTTRAPVDGVTLIWNASDYGTGYQVYRDNTLNMRSGAASTVPQRLDTPRIAGAGGATLPCDGADHLATRREFAPIA